MTLSITSTHERKLSRAAGARVWESFLRSGSGHSPAAAMLPYLIRRCEQEKVPYVLEAVPGMGYFIRPCVAREEKTDDARN